MASSKWWVTTAVVAVLGVGSVAGYAGFKAAEQKAIQHDPPQPLPVVHQLVQKANNHSKETKDLQALIDDPALGSFVGRISNASTGETIWSNEDNEPVRPASTMKVLTAAAALLKLPHDHEVETAVVKQSANTVVIRGGGDVRLTEENIETLADAAGTADQVLVDTSAWKWEPMHPAWDPADIPAGFIAPMEPVMLDQNPRSATPGLDVAKAVADRIGATSFGYTTNSDGDVVKTIKSKPLFDRLHYMMLESDNVVAESIGREVALAVDSSGKTDPPTAVSNILKEHGISLDGARIDDTSGLSEDNLLTAKILDDIMLKAATSEQLRDLLYTLPVAGGTGTLKTRFNDTDGEGWVRAKTGTLTDTSSLAGTVTSRDGVVYTFALISNQSEVLPARSALDALTTALR
ncbi:MAG: D-alanyl-D-alanine carboxypeptidase/D-alanyl-D-alanine-endopeptidase [Corynebacterium sp.]|nr:D-alanyl-D-alanine carboxypeptidase/D-alanyl-D-alanine-endopeptidase [Corynebacterium sp.]